MHPAILFVLVLGPYFTMMDAAFVSTLTRQQRQELIAPYFTKNATINNNSTESLVDSIHSASRKHNITHSLHITDAAPRVLYDSVDTVTYSMPLQTLFRSRRTNVKGEIILKTYRVYTQYNNVTIVLEDNRWLIANISSDVAHITEEVVQQ